MESTAQRKRKRNVATTSPASYSHTRGLTNTNTTTSSPHPGPTASIRVREAHLVSADHPKSERDGIAAAVEKRDRSGVGVCRVATDHAVDVDDPVAVDRSSSSSPSSSVRAGLISWKRAVGLIPDKGDGVEGSGEVSHPTTADDDDDDVWVDRFDALLLLLTSLPTTTTINRAPHPASEDDDGTWSDLPSDAEDTFFLSPLETQAYRRDKRTRAMDRQREDRMRALEAQEERQRDVVDEDSDVWGGDDEEPPSQPQLDLMRRTARHVLSSPNPAQLEGRILANHGADPRFAFLRGRWRRRWEAIKLDVTSNTNTGMTDVRQTTGSGVLVAYGSDSDSDADAEVVDSTPTTTTMQEGDLTPPSPRPPPSGSNRTASPASVAAAEQEAKRARLREWTRRRREANAKANVEAAAV